MYHCRNLGNLRGNGGPQYDTAIIPQSPVYYVGRVHLSVTSRLSSENSTLYGGM